MFASLCRSSEAISVVRKYSRSLPRLNAVSLSKSDVICNCGGTECCPIVTQAIRVRWMLEYLMCKLICLMPSSNSVFA